MAGLSGISNLQHLRALIALSRYGSLRNASLETDISIPTLRRHIEALEEDVGIDLVLRGQQQIEFTAAGRRLLESALRVERELAQVQAAVEMERVTCSGEVTLSAVDGTGTEWLIPHLQRFGLTLPEVQIRLTISPFNFGRNYEDFDLVIEVGEPTDQNRVNRRVARYTCGFYCASSLVERFGYARQLADLQDLPYVGSDWLRTHEAGGERFFAQHGLQPKEVMHTNSCSAQVNAVAAGLGWAVMSHRWARNHANIVRLVPSMNVVETELWLSARRGFARIARVKALYDFLLCSFEEDRELFVADDEDLRSER